MEKTNVDTFVTSVMPMPDDTMHIIFNFIVLSIIFIVYQYFNQHIEILRLTLFVIAYIIGTIVLNPDLDSARSRPSQRGGILLRPYTMMSKHRGHSHDVFTGTLLRIIYIVILLLLIIWMFFGFPQIRDFFIIGWKYKIELFFAVLGLFLSNLFHILLDSIC